MVTGIFVGYSVSIQLYRFGQKSSNPVPNLCHTTCKDGPEIIWTITPTVIMAVAIAFIHAVHIQLVKSYQTENDTSCDY